MVTLEQWDRERREAHDVLNDFRPRRNGIACPGCEKELYDTEPCMTLATFPPKKAIHCPECKWKGYRLA